MSHHQSQRNKTKKGVFFIALIVGFTLTTTETFADVATTNVGIINPLGPTAVVEAEPEKRVPNVTDSRIRNLTTQVFLRFFSPDADRSDFDNSTYDITVTTDDDGINSSVILEGLTTSTYDITAKGYSHLTRVMEDVEVNAHVNLDFTFDDTTKLLAGDINSFYGDNEVNALDVNVLIQSWGTNSERADLNQDFEVNALDVSTLIDNFNKTGD